MKCVEADFETASKADLRKIGAWKYAADFTTFILCLDIKVVTDGRPTPTRNLSEKQLHKLDPELMALAADPDVIFIAHNAGFEQAMWHFHMVPMGYPAMGPERWHDSMAVCAMKALPLGLDAAITALDLPIKKDMEGHRHMLIMCKPDRLGTWSHHNDFNLERLYSYCGQDVDSQWGLYLATKGLGPSERETWILDQRINQRGILIDKEFVNACIDVLNQVRIPMTERFRDLTGLKPTQREKVLAWVNEQGVPLTDMKKETLNAILDPDDEFDIGDFQEALPYNVHEVLTLRRSLASSSVSKLQRMLDCAGGDGRVRYTMQYHGARTGRWAGRLIQIQNFPRGEIALRQGLTPDILANAILSRDVETIREMWGPDIFTAVISSLRSCIIPSPGKLICAGDFRTVEARNLLAMAGQFDRLDAMASGIDVYNELASMVFKRPINRKVDVFEGQIGKNGFLGNGYGLGPVGFRARFCPKEPIDLAILAVNTYRKDFAPMVPKFWYQLFEASCRAVWCERGATYSHAGIEFTKEGDYLTMRLPSGRKIYYHRPRKERGYNPVRDEETAVWSFMSYQGKKFRRHYAWHGMVTADCIQGLSRDLTVHAIKLCERENLPVIFSAHDEVVLEVDDNGTDYAKILNDIMTDIPHWAIERRFRIEAETGMMNRYRK